MRKFTSEFYRAEYHLRTLRACCFWNYCFAWVYTIKFDIFSLMFYNPLYLISRKQSSFLLFSLFILVYWIKDNHMWFTWIEVFLTHSCRSIKSFKEFLTSFMTKSYFFHSFLWLLTQVFDWQYILWVFHWSIYTFQFL